MNLPLCVCLQVEGSVCILVGGWMRLDEHAKRVEHLHATPWQSV